MAMTTQYAVGTWVGYHTREQALVSGGMEYLTEPLARGFIQYVSTGTPVNWQEPAGIKTLPAYVQTAHVGLGSEEPGPSTDLYPSWYNPPTASSHSYVIDKVSNMLATSCTPALARQTVSSGYNANVFSIDTFVNSGNSSASSSGTSGYNTTQYDDVHQCGEAQPSISFNEPTDTCSGGSCTVNVTVTQGAHPLSSSKYPLTINMIVNGQTIAANCNLNFDTGDPTTASSGQGSCTFSYSSAGTFSVSAQIIDSVLDSSTSTNPDSITFS